MQPETREHLPAAPCAMMTPEADRRLTSMETTLGEIKAALIGNPDLGHKGLVARIEAIESIAGRTPCPNPGHCVTLARDVEAIREENKANAAAIRQFQSVLDQARGFGAAGRMLWAFIGAGGIGIASIAYQLISAGLGK